METEKRAATPTLQIQDKNTKKSVTKNKDGGFILFEDQYVSLMKMDDEMFGKLMKAAYEFHFFDKDTSDLPDLIRFPFEALKLQSQYLKEKYIERCEKNRQNSLSRKNKN
jgi:hypothetical protein